MGAAARESYADAYAEAAKTLGPGEADREAGRVVLDGLQRAAIEARRQQALAIRARRSILEGVAGLKERRGYTGVEALGGKGGQPPRGGWVQGGLSLGDASRPFDAILPGIMKEVSI